MLGWTVLAIAMVASVALIGVVASDATFGGDEWGYVHRLASEPLPDAVVDRSHGGYLIALPMLIYAGLVHTVGIASYVPYRVVGLALLLAADALLFELMRRRIGALAALPPAILMLFLGSSAEVVAIPVRMPSQVSLVAGLGMLLAIERRDRRGDILACALLFVAIISHPLGLAFAAAAVASVALRPAGDRLRAWWIVVPAIAVFALWWVTLHGSFAHSVNPSIGDVVSFSAQSFVATCAAITGLFRAPWAGGADYINGFSIGASVLIAAAIAWRIATVRPIKPTVWVMLAGLLVAVAAPAFAATGSLFSVRQPDAQRYLYPNAFLLCLLGAEVGSGLRLGRGARTLLPIAAVLVFGVSLVANTRLLVARAHDYEIRGTLVKSKLAGAQLAFTREPPPPAVVRDEDAAGSQLIFFVSSPSPLPPGALAAYQSVSEQFGTPAFSGSELSQQSESLQEVAHKQLISALRLDRERGG